jgi:hydroxyacylglutathione hydrolase
VLELTDGINLDLAGIQLTTGHAPGHTPGSIVFEYAGSQDVPPLLFSGDLLFQGSIGRTDLPGGNHQQMLSSLSRVLTPLPEETVVLPGHGDQTTMAAERATNPYLADLGPAPLSPKRGL